VAKNSSNDKPEMIANKTRRIKRIIPVKVGGI
jgi:hypothetical protein